MDLRRLQVFSKVYERRSFSRAAEEVLLSQPTVSGHVKTLEEELGVQLFDRLGREIMPTRAAELLYDYAKRILALTEEAGSAVDAFLGRLRGELILGGSTIPGQWIMPQLIGDFRQVHPEVRVTLEVSDTQEVCDRVLNGELELGMVGARLDEERLAFAPVASDPVTLVVPPGHPLAGQEVDVAEIMRHPVILREPGSGTRMFFTDALKKAGLDPSKLEVAAQMGSTTAALQAVRAGVGITFVSRRAAHDCLAAGKLGEARVKGLKLERKFYLVTRKGRSQSPASQAFAALCLAQAELVQVVE